MIAKVVTFFATLTSFMFVVFSFDSRDVVFVIVSQSEPYNAGLAEALKRDIQQQVMQLENRLPTVHLSQELGAAGDWTFVPLFPTLLARRGAARWLVWLDPLTAVRCHVLLRVLEAASKREEVQWLGYPLRDAAPSILHHFARGGPAGALPYPLAAAGFAMRFALVEWLMNQFSSGKRKEVIDFSIDAPFELAQLIYGSQGSEGPLLTPEPAFCSESAEHCATYPLPYPVCEGTVSEEQVLFAVKTWRGYHQTRARRVKSSWGRYVTNLMFFSDLLDPSLPSIDLGIPNTKTGHCAKMIAMLKYLSNKITHMKNIKWIFIADDDTILGVHRVCEVLSCYNASDDVMIGDRYGYGHWGHLADHTKSNNGEKGYDYITGGGGTVLSVGALRKLAGGCRCGAAGAAGAAGGAAGEAADDMVLGQCARTQRLHVVHTAQFHQCGPSSYAREAVRAPATFHRYEPGRALYRDWFLEDDRRGRKRKKDEL